MNLSFDPLKTAKSASLGFVSLGGLCVLLAGTVLAPPAEAQAQMVAPAIAVSLCPSGGFDVCFPNLGAGAPNAACSVTEEGAADVSECLRRVCRSAATEPEPGFFSYCCARGGSVRYDDFCVLVVQSECSAVADHCADRCPPVELLTGTVTLSPPTAACVAGYPAFVASVCEVDPFCCSTSWDSICAEEAVAARAEAVLLGGSIASSGITSSGITSSGITLVGVPAEGVAVDGVDPDGAL